MTFALSKCLRVLFGSRISERRYLPFREGTVTFLQGSLPLNGQNSDLNNLNKFLNQVIMSRGSNRRWFDNPYPDYNSASGDAVNLENVRKLALEKAEEALIKGSKDGDGGVYVGAVGCTYMILHIYDKLTEDEKRRLMPMAINAYQNQSLYYHQNPGTRNDEAAFLLGKAGHYAVGAVLGQITGNQQLIDECIQHYVAASNVCKPIDFFRHGGDELFVGRAGYLCGALWLQQKLGYQPVPKEALKTLWSAIVESGKRYAARNRSPCPLMYSYYETEYLGAAHGLCAILQILLSFPAFMSEDKDAATIIKATVDFYLTLQDQNGNFPCAMDERGNQARRPDEMLVHWCHGAPGAIYLFAKAFSVFKENKYLEACVKCGELMWSRGLLRKGPGICHGVAGNGYVFLIINQLLGGNDAKNLYRAGKFGEFLEDSKFVREARRPDCPYSLYEGWAGAVCYLMDLLQPQRAEFPFFNMSVEYTG